MNLPIQTVVLFNARVVLSTQCFIMLKDYVIMLNTYFVFSTQCPIMLKGYVIMLKRWVILFTKHVNLSIQLVIMEMGVLFCVHNILLCQKTTLIQCMLKTWVILSMKYVNLSILRLII